LQGESPSIMDVDLIASSLSEFIERPTSPFNARTSNGTARIAPLAAFKPNTWLKPRDHDLHSAACKVSRNGYIH
jgi:hypothetical protein